MEKQDKVVEIGDKFILLVPGDFEISSGSGDDTQFVQIYTEDGRIFIGYESGVESEKSFSGPAELKEKSQVAESINDVDGNALWLAYEPTNAKLRDIRGKLFIQDHNQLMEILNFSCNSENLEQIRQIFKTFKKK